MCWGSCPRSRSRLTREPAEGETVPRYNLKSQDWYRCITTEGLNDRPTPYLILSQYGSAGTVPVVSARVESAF